MEPNNDRSEPERVCVIGAGTMGIGIAQVFAVGGHPVHVVESNDGILNKNRARLGNFLDRLVEKGNLSADARGAIDGRLSFSKQIESVDSDATLAIEAVVEDLDVKRRVLSFLDSRLSAEAVLASNTSSLSIVSLASACTHPDRVVGMHFFNPAPLMRLVEIIPSVTTTPGIVQRSRDVIKKLGKTPVIAKDVPGFIVNRVARPFYGESLRILEEGIADVPTIDTALRDIGGFRMGPFELMDLIGNDVNFSVTQSVYSSLFFDPRYRPSIVQQRMVEAGYLGRKSGRGYYDYSGNSEARPLEDVALQERIFNRVLCMLINEAVDAVSLSIASPEDIDLAMTLGTNYPKGLLAWGSEVGFDGVLDTIDALYDEYHEDRYRASPLLRRLAAGSVELDV